MILDHTTITDKQILELKQTARNPTELCEAEMASSEFHRVMGHKRWLEARIRCAEILNARQR